MRILRQPCHPLISGLFCRKLVGTAVGMMRLMPGFYVCLFQIGGWLQADNQNRPRTESQRLTVRVPALATVLANEPFSQPQIETAGTARKKLISKSNPRTTPAGSSLSGMIDAKRGESITQISVRVSILTAVWTDPPSRDAKPVPFNQRALLISPGQTRVLQLPQSALNSLAIAPQQATTARSHAATGWLHPDAPNPVLHGLVSPGPMADGPMADGGLASDASVPAIWIVPQW